MSYTENGCLLLPWNEADLTKVGASAQQMIPAANQVAATNLTNSGTFCTFTCTASTLFFNGQVVFITGANDAGFNGQFQIFNVATAAGVTTFNYQATTAPTVAFGQANASTLKFRMALAQADPTNGAAITIGPNSTGAARSLNPGQEYQIPQVFGAQGQPVRYDMAQWYWVGANGSKIHIIYV